VKGAQTGRRGGVGEHAPDLRSRAVAARRASPWPRLRAARRWRSATGWVASLPTGWTSSLPSWTRCWVRSW